MMSFKPLVGCLLATFFISQNCFAQSYSFQHQVKMNIAMYEGEEQKQSMDYLFLFPEEGDYYGAKMSMGGVQAKAIFDMGKMIMTTLMDQGGMKMGMQYDLNKTLEAMGEEGENDSGNITKTGDTKDILGYKCYEYTVNTNDGSHAQIWVTPELEMANVYTGFAALNKKQKIINTDMPAGFLMELTSWPKGKDSSEKFEMKAIAINLNQASSISSEGYSIMKLN